MDKSNQLPTVIKYLNSSK